MKMQFLESQKPSQDKDYVKTVSVALNPEDNGGEQVILSVDFFHNGDKENAIYVNVHFEQGCYGSHSNSQSYWDIPIENFEQAFSYMKEIASSLDKKS